MSKENVDYNKEIARSICRLYSTVSKVVEHESEAKNKSTIDDFSKRRRVLLTTQEERLLVNLLEGVDENIRK